jgi:hypothetical protein
VQCCIAALHVCKGQQETIFRLSRLTGVELCTLHLHTNYVLCIVDHIFTYAKLTEVRYTLNYSLCRVKFEQNIKFVYAAMLVTRLLQVTRIRVFQHFRQVFSFMPTRHCGKIV